MIVPYALVLCQIAQIHYGLARGDQTKINLRAWQKTLNMIKHPQDAIWIPKNPDEVMRLQYMDNCALCFRLTSNSSNSLQFGQGDQTKIDLRTWQKTLNMIKHPWDLIWLPKNPHEVRRLNIQIIAPYALVLSNNSNSLHFGQGGPS